MFFKARYHDHEIIAKASRPLTTRFSVAIDGETVAESARPVSTDLICGIKTWFGLKPVWEIGGRVKIDGEEHEVTAKYYTTFTRVYVEIYVDGELIGPEKESR